MNNAFIRTIAAVVSLSCSLGPSSALALTRYVWSGSSTPVAPYTNWNTAARVIQDAVDVAQTGDTVLVTNGVYNTGGRVVFGSLTNRICITKAITVLSVNGPDATWIIGAGAGGGTNNGDGAVRCAYVCTNALLSGFTLTGGHTRTTGYNEEMYGGGVYCETSGIVSNSVVTRNSAISGGGAYRGHLDNCLLSGNSCESRGGGSFFCTLNSCTLMDNVSKSDGGGSCAGTLNGCVLIRNLAAWCGGGYSDNYAGVLNNCTLIENRARISGGGAYAGTLNNCILYNNSAATGSNYTLGTLNHCCTMPLPLTGANNISADPLLASASHISMYSPCLGKGSTSYTPATDIDGDDWQAPPCIGADQYHAGASTTALSMTIFADNTNVSVGFPVRFLAQNQGRISASVWEFGDGTVVSNQASIKHVWNVPGYYSVKLTGYNESNPDGVTATTLVQVVTQPVFYVDANNPNSAYPYTNWATAAREIQDAIDAGNVAGRLVLVTNGTYNTGGRAVFGSMTNRVALDQPVIVQSVSGPELTFIVGTGAGGGTTNGEGAIRCAYVGNDAVLRGFTLTNGHTRIDGDFIQEQSGGGAWCDIDGTVWNCMLVSNSARQYGGGSFSGRLNNCTFTSNSVLYGGGGSSYSTLDHCILTGNSTREFGVGGGSLGGTLNNCTLIGNWAALRGGGARACTLSNSVLSMNWVTALGIDKYGARTGDGTGGGAEHCTLMNCTVTNNSAAYGGGVSAATLTNCFLAGNLATNFGGAAEASVLEDCVLAVNSARIGGGSYGSSLRGCTISSNSARLGAGSAYGTNKNSILKYNFASSGGGSYSDLLISCVLLGNGATNGGASWRGTLNNCTLIRNYATNYAGGSYEGTLNNCIIYYNDAGACPNYKDGTLNYCCTTPLPPSETNNITAEPLLLTTWHLSGLSPCLGKGSSTYAFGVDIDGQPWQTPPCIGADQFVEQSITGMVAIAISASFTNVASGFPVKFVAESETAISSCIWDFGDGIRATNEGYISHTWSMPGIYTVTLTAYNDSSPNGVSTSTLIHVEPGTHFVNASNAAPVFPYTSWDTAAQTIQDALDCSDAAGRMVLVTNGMYGTGGKALFGTSTNRIAVPSFVTVQSVNGPDVTLIVGTGTGGSTNNGDGAIRCAYASAKAVISGFTLTNGHTLTNRTMPQLSHGGGAWCEIGALVTNCVLVANSAVMGGGAYQGTFQYCTFVRNSAENGGGAHFCNLVTCILGTNSAKFGGGASYGSLNGCQLIENSATSYGGGASSATLTNCVLTGNSAPEGGGACAATLHDCTLNSNWARNKGGGLASSTATNCYLIGNSAQSGGGCFGGTCYACSLTSNTATNDGGGVCESVLYSSVLTSNCANSYGGGASGGTLYNSILSGNSSRNYGGGAYGAMLQKCTLSSNSVTGVASRGGGSFSNKLDRCTLIGNSAHYGGGCSAGSLTNCVLIGNSAISGGGSFEAKLSNCSVAGNSATAVSGGSYNDRLTNCIVYHNTAPTDPNYHSGFASYTCSLPLPAGTSNICAEPLFVDYAAGDLHLISNSPCIDTGNDLIVDQGWLDLDGKQRILGRHVEMGAFEFLDTNRPVFVGLNWVTNQAPLGGSIYARVNLAPNSNRPSYQWYRNGSVLLAGCTTPTLYLTKLKLNDAGDYSIVVSNCNGSVTGMVMTLYVTYKAATPVWSEADSNFSMGLQAEPGRAYWLEARDDFETSVWTVISGVTNTEGIITLTDTNVAFPRRFYRMGSAPIP